MRCTFDPSEVSIWGEGQRAAAEGVGVARQHDVRWNNLGQCVCKVFFFICIRYVIIKDCISVTINARSLFCEESSAYTGGMA